MKLWVAVGDNEKFIYWPSVSVNKLDCKAKVYAGLCEPFGDKISDIDVEYKRIKVEFINE